MSKEQADGSIFRHFRESVSGMVANVFLTVLASFFKPCPELSKNAWEQVIGSRSQMFFEVWPLFFLRSGRCLL